MIQSLCPLVSDLRINPGVRNIYQEVYSQNENRGYNGDRLYYREITLECGLDDQHAHAGPVENLLGNYRAE